MAYVDDLLINGPRSPATNLVSELKKAYYLKYVAAGRRDEDEQFVFYLGEISITHEGVSWTHNPKLVNSLLEEWNIAARRPENKHTKRHPVCTGIAAVNQY